jgi:hypothetical protein
MTNVDSLASTNTNSNPVLSPLALAVFAAVIVSAQAAAAQSEQCLTTR